MSIYKASRIAPCGSMRTRITPMTDEHEPEHAIVSGLKLVEVGDA